MRQVLRKLKLVDEDDVLTFKGRAACEISVANELVVIELLFDRCLKKYSTEPYKLASLLCCFVAEKQGNEKNDKSKYDQTEAHGDLSRLGTMIADVLYECELPVDAEEFVDQFLHGRIMDIAARWLQGRNFVELGIPASMPAGSVVRILRRLHELLQQLEAAAKVMGDEELASRLYKTATLMHRGVVFSASLYL